MRQTVGALLLGLVLGVGATAGVLVLDDARYEYRTINSFTPEQRQQMVRSGTSCMPIGASGESPQVWFRCPRVRLFP
jgi:hypothetical protein